MFSRRVAQKGSITLPFEGAFLLLTVFFPMWAFPMVWMQYLSASIPGLREKAVVDPVSTSTWLVLAVTAIPVYLVTLFILIGLPIFTKITEVYSIQNGLGITQLWHGRTVREKVLRTAARLLLLLSAMGIGWLVCIAVYSLPPKVYWFGWAFVSEIALIVLFYCVFRPLKERWPRLAGFDGDRTARYHHVY